MKHYSKPTTPFPAKDAESTSTPPSSEISVQRLIDDSLIALYREVKNLLTLSTRGKLDSANARDLRDHLKLLFELRDRELDSLKGKTDEQLKEEARSVLTDDE